MMMPSRLQVIKEILFLWLLILVSLSQILGSQPPNFSNSNAMETESFQEFSWGLTDIECHPILQATTSTELKRELPWEPCIIESSGS